MIQREAKFYTTAFEGEEPLKAPFYIRAKEAFDGPRGDLNASLIDRYNEHLAKKEVFSGVRLIFDKSAGEAFPEKIVIINASGDDLPTSYETARIFSEHLEGMGVRIPVYVVNTRRELSGFARECEATLFISQCVKKEVYDTEFARRLEASGAVVVPGEITAPGSVFSDKSKTYELLSDHGRSWGMVARYEKVPYEGFSASEVASGIMDAVDIMAERTGDDKFFVKPCEGGGGLGGFRISKFDGKYYIPDLSKVTGRSEGVHPTYINLDVDDEAKMRELLYIYSLFRADPVMRKNYIRTDIRTRGMEDTEPIKEYLLHGRKLRSSRMQSMMLERNSASMRISEAIECFERKFKKRYSPLVNEHLDFGLWGLRAHYRISSRGLLLETMYHRIFQLAFTPQGVGYLGSDNISNKQTGDLEIMRLGPIEKVMLESIGGQDALFRTLDKGALAAVKLRELAGEPFGEFLPIRLQMDLAAVSERIGEGNADTARGLCLASRWEHFIENARSWLEDSLAYYAVRKLSSEEERR